MKKAVCNKSDLWYTFEKGNIYLYYIVDRENIYIINKYNSHCSFDNKHFNEHFIDYNKLRKKKLQQLL